MGNTRTMSAETFGIDYYSIQIAVAITFAIIGAIVYTMYRFHVKKDTINEVNKVLNAGDIAIQLEQINFDPKFWKTAAFASAASIVIVLLSYVEVVETIIPGEHIMITAAKAAALGATLNFIVNWAATGGGKINSVIMAVLQALMASSTEKTSPENLQTAKRVLESHKFKVRIISKDQYDDNLNSVKPKPNPDPEL